MTDDIRAKLAAAQKRLRDAEQEHAAAQAVAGDSWEITADARKAVKDAEGALAEADRYAVDDLIAKRMGQTVPERPSRRELEADLTAAEAALDAAKAARNRLDARVATAQGAVNVAQADVHSALAELLHGAPEVAELLADIKTAEQHLIDLYHALAAVGGLAETRTHQQAALVAKAFTRDGRHPDWNMLPPPADGEVVAAWRDAVRKLQTDAHTPLPGGTAPATKPRRRIAA